MCIIFNEIKAYKYFINFIVTGVYLCINIHRYYFFNKKIYFYILLNIYRNISIYIKEFIYILYIISNNIPKPNRLVTNQLQSNLEITDIINQLNKLLPQVNKFINQFHDEIIKHNINVITDTSGNLAIDIPDSIPQAQGKLISARINLLDRLIHTQTDKSEDLIYKGIEIEEKLFNKYPNYETRLTNYVSEFRRLKSSYKH